MFVFDAKIVGRVNFTEFDDFEKVLISDIVDKGVLPGDDVVVDFLGLAEEISIK